MTSRQWIHGNGSPSLAASEANMVAASEEDRLQQQATAMRGEGEIPEQCFRKVDRRIRSVLQHNKHLPSVSDNIKNVAVLMSKIYVL